MPESTISTGFPLQSPMTIQVATSAKPGVLPGFSTFSGSANDAP